MTKTKSVGKSWEKLGKSWEIVDRNVSGIKNPHFPQKAERAKIIFGTLFFSEKSPKSQFLKNGITYIVCYDGKKSYRKCMEKLRKNILKNT